MLLTVHKKDWRLFSVTLILQDLKEKKKPGEIMIAGTSDT